MAADKEPQESTSRANEERIPIRDVKVFIKEHLLEFQAVDVSSLSIRLHHLDWRFHVDQKLTMKLTMEGMTLVSDLPAVVVEMDEETVLCRFLYRDSRQRIMVLDLISRAKSKNVLAEVEDEESGAPAAEEDEATVLVKVLTDLKKLPGREPDPGPVYDLETCPVCLSSWQAEWERCATCGYDPGEDAQDDEVRVIMELEDGDDPDRTLPMQTLPPQVLAAAARSEKEASEADQKSSLADTQDWADDTQVMDDFEATVLMDEVPGGVGASAPATMDEAEEADEVDEDAGDIDVDDDDDDLTIDIDLATDGEEPPHQESAPSEPDTGESAPSEPDQGQAAEVPAQLEPDQAASGRESGAKASQAQEIPETQWMDPVLLSPDASPGQAPGQEQKREPARNDAGAHAAPPAKGREAAAQADDPDDGRELVFAESWTPPRAPMAPEAPPAPEAGAEAEGQAKDLGDTQSFDPREWILEEPPMEVAEDEALFIEAAKADPGSRRGKDNGDEVLDPENLFSQATMTMEVEDIEALEHMASLTPEPVDEVSDRRLEIPDAEDEDLDEEMEGEEPPELPPAEEQSGEDKRPEIPAAVARALARAAEAEYRPSIPFRDPRPLEELLGIDMSEDADAGPREETGEARYPDGPDMDKVVGAETLREISDQVLEEKAAVTLGGDEVLARLLMDQGPAPKETDEDELEGAVKEYYELFRLSREPFSNSPDPEFYYQAWQHRECLKRIEITVRLRRGMCVILGEVGTGKTTMSRQLHRVFSRDESVITFLFLEPLFKAGVEFLLQLSETIEAETPQPGASEHEILESIKNRLFELAVEQDKTVALIFDEGQRIPGHCLELLRLLLNYETNSNKLIQIVIFAQNEFEETIKVQHNFKDRINDLIRLEPLTQRETGEMIRYRLERAYKGYGAPELFTPAALRMVYKITQGYPRKIVNVCHKTLLALAREEREVATPEMVRQGAKEATLPPRSRMRLYAGLGVLLLALAIAALLLLGPWFRGGDRGTEPMGRPDSGSAETAPPVVPPVSPEDAPEAVPDIAPEAADQGAPEIAPESGETAAVDAASDSGHEATLPEQQAEAGADGQADESMTDESMTDESAAGDFEDQAASAASQGETTEVEIAGNEPADAASAPGGSADDAADSGYPRLLGSVVVEREILSQMIYDVYGQFNNDLLQPVIQANPHIGNIDALATGTSVHFPLIRTTEQPDLPLTRNWLGLGDADTLQQAYDILRQVRGHGLDALLLAYWSPSQGLRFSVVGRDSYSQDFHTFTVIEGLGELPQELRDHARIISEFEPGTVFFNSKHPLP